MSCYMWMVGQTNWNGGTWHGNQSAEILSPLAIISAFGHFPDWKFTRNSIRSPSDIGKFLVFWQMCCQSRPRHYSLPTLQL